MEEFKFSCPQCGQHIQCGVGYSGTQINCPVCQQVIVVPPVPHAASAAQPLTAVKSRALQNVLVITAAVLVLAGLGVGGWYGYSKIKMRKLPPGLVALWSGESGNRDSAGGHKMQLTDISFADGKVGRAFSFNGTSSYFKIPDDPTLNVGAGEGLTISAWIKPSDVNGFHAILEWQPGEAAPGLIGVQIWIGHNPSSRGVLQAAVVGVDGNPHFLISHSGAVVADKFQQVVLTYDKASGRGILYLNGAVAAQSQWGSFVPLTKGDISNFRPSNPGDWTYNRFFAGLMDELAIYNRALSASEVQAIYAKQK